MAKFFGKVGYAITTETAPSVWEEEIKEREYYGDVLSNTKRYQGTDQVNDNIEINNRIEIVADPFAYENFFYIRYVTWMGQKWKVTSVDVGYPRLTLNIGGIYTVEEQT